MTTQTHATNSLAHASSSYLRSAMHQPIRWFEWGAEAFETATRENKPILLDIGAVWCHWCHVMDRESYDDPGVAQIVNENYVAIKVDRDERPDIDSRYQSAISAMTGQGGWPLTAFLTPDGKPFFGGTYFPPVDGYGRPSFKRVLLTLAQAFKEKRADVDEQAQTVMNMIARSETFAGREQEPVSPQIVDHIVGSAQGMFDSRHGGFGSAPKFPHSSAIDLLLHRYARTGDPDVKEICVKTLEKMARGGIYDQLAGGFHRYSVDERWVVPHFEKMSYDNSELLKNFVHGYQATGNPFFAAVAKDIIRWMDEWLSDRERGGFYASQDADYSMDDDGDYFTWTLDEARAVLTGDELKVAADYYDIGEVGDMHHNHLKNVLFVKSSLEEIAVRNGMQIDRASNLLDSAKQKMYAARLKRPTPYVDKTVYVNWNGLCISAYLQAATVLSLDAARQFALKSLDRILAEGWNPQTGLRHVIAYSDPKAADRKSSGFLDDYTFVGLACLDAYEATGNIRYFESARAIADHLIRNFYDEQAGGFFDAPKSSADAKQLGALTAQRKPFQDSPTPSGNSSAAILLLKLHGFTNDVSYRVRAEKTLGLFAGLAEQVGIFAGTYGIASVWLMRPHTQVVVIGNDQAAQHLYAAAVAPFALNKSLIRVVEVQQLPPALAETVPNIPAVQEGKSVAVVCSNFTCLPPMSGPDQLANTLAEVLSR
ncbi:MAG TPA: thioredoxin domain-containing protein [Terriglobales bacterium]|nr:thioredoxin domain-containing protein [Terriglobales bacterium]